MSLVGPGDIIAGKYRVERTLGSGGMGYVVAARHLQLDQLVAIKFLRQGGLDGDEAAKRFEREAKAAGRLRNPHIARVFDVGTLENGDPYMVLEHLEGRDLAAVAKERRSIPVAEAVEYVIQACEALSEAHGLGIIHRDIKLANIFVTRGPSGGPLVKVLDFGISKTNPFGESEHDMTRTSAMLGSPRFMSPEQMRDPRAVDPRSDIWSLGVVLYRLISGVPPFEAETLGRLITMVMHEQEAPLSQLCADVPLAFDAIVGRCLKKDPTHRFANVADLAYALAAFSADPDRARGVADRIAGTLALGQARPSARPPHVEITGPMPLVLSSRGKTDPGTAAPWVGTQSTEFRLWSPRRAGLIGVGIAFAAMLVGTALFVRLKTDPLRDASSAASASQGVDSVESGVVEGAAMAVTSASAAAPPSSSVREILPPVAVTPAATTEAPTIAARWARPLPKARPSRPSPARTEGRSETRGDDKVETEIPNSRD